MTQRLAVLAVLGALEATALGCAPGSVGTDRSDPPASCEEAQCESGTCSMTSAGTPLCECAPGYRSDGPTRCVPLPPQAGPCDGVTCSGHGTCTVVSDAPVCNCTPGYRANGNACEVDACANIVCSGHGQCVQVGTSPSCQCDAGFNPNGAACVLDCNTNTNFPAAGGIEITEIQINQAVTIQVANNDSQVARSSYNAPVVPNRAGILRVFVSRAAGFSSRPIVARLTLNGVERDMPVNVSSDSTVGSLSSTINFELSAGDIQEDLSYSVAFLEPSACATSVGTVLPRYKFPASGYAATIFVAAANTYNSEFNVVLVPVNYKNSYTPDMNAALPRFRENLLSSMPANANTTISVASTPISFSSTVYPTSGWSALLSECESRRLSDRPPRNTYYYCVIQIGASFRSYCTTSCVTGLGNIPDADNIDERVAVGIEFPDYDGSQTFVHEIGHTLGRPHAPCGGPAGVESAFPYRDGSIGVWGYHPTKRVLYDPSSYKDLMSYCDPEWTSDYAYKKVFERINHNGAYYRIPGPLNDTTRRQLIIDRDPTSPSDVVMHWGSLVIKAGRILDGDTVAVTYLDEAGNALSTTDAVLRPLTHVDSWFVYVPMPTAFTPAAVRIDNFGVVAY